MGTIHLYDSLESVQSLMQKYAINIVDFIGKQLYCRNFLISGIMRFESYVTYFKRKLNVNI